MNIQIKKGVIEMCVLQIISNSDTYGYEIVKKISRYVETSENTIYPILHRLTRDKYIEAYYNKTSDGPRRKYYRITDEGICRLEASKEDWFSFINSVDGLINEVIING